MFPPSFPLANRVAGLLGDGGEQAATLLARGNDGRSLLDSNTRAAKPDVVLWERDRPAGEPVNFEKDIVSFEDVNEFAGLCVEQGNALRKATEAAANPQPPRRRLDSEAAAVRLVCERKSFHPEPRFRAIFMAAASLRGRISACRLGRAAVSSRRGSIPG